MVIFLENIRYSGKLVVKERWSQRRFDCIYTAVLRKVVPKKRISVIDDVERYYGYWWLQVS